MSLFSKFFFLTSLLTTSSVLADSHSSVGKCEGSQKELASCNLGSCNSITCIDCQWSPWADWGPCSCVGLQERHRSITEHNNECGKPCSGAKIETQTCDAPCHKEPINCQLDEWSSWGVCDKNCGGGQMSRERKVLTELAHNGKPCDGLLKETKSCNTQSCGEPVDAVLSEWGEWTGCSKSCGSGQKSRSRTIEVVNKNGGQPADGSLTETRTCNEEDCESKQDCEWGEWESWSACSKSCNGGEKTRSRLIVTAPRNNGKLCDPMDMSEVASCNNDLCDTPIDCELGSWSSWDDCSCSCNGIQQRARLISVYPSKGGQPCDGNLKEIRSCNEDNCIATTPPPPEAVDGELSYWSTWSQCSASCGSGIQTRSRMITQHPKNGGKAPTGDLKEIQGCNYDVSCEGPPESHPDPVDCGYSEWDSWGACSVSCDGGQMVRQRQVTQMANAYGKGCELHSSMEVAPCNTDPCEAVDCEWGEWSTWSSPSCTGLCERHRQISVHQKGVGKPCEGSKIQTKRCENPDCVKKPVDCRLAEWDSWSQCDKECGGGQTYRIRGIMNEARNGGKGCSEDAVLKEVKECNTDECTEAVDCVIGEWGSWSACSASCDGGQQYRHRGVQTHSSNGGKPCTDELSEVRGCGTEQCESSLDCIWGDWSNFGACSATCGGGLKMRDRSIKQAPRNGGQLCDAKTKTEVVPCATQACDKHCVDAAWSEWGEWSSCSASCDSGYSFRSRKVAISPNHCGAGLDGESQEYKECNTQSCKEVSVDCAFSEWSEFGDCSCPCNGIKDRTRRITTYAQGAGAPCEGPLKEVHSCNKPDGNSECGPEPVDCVLSSFSEWSTCTAECGGGSQTRSRTVLTPPQNHGKACEGTLSEVQGCNDFECEGSVDCAWGEWHSWGACSKACGGGQRSRFRHIETMAKLSGKPCDSKASAEVESCNEQPCGEPQYCGWGEWSPFSDCSATCGSGLKERTRALMITSTRPTDSDDSSSANSFVILENLVGTLNMIDYSKFGTTFMIFGSGMLVSMLMLNIAGRLLSGSGSNNSGRSELSQSDDSDLNGFEMGNFGDMRRGFVNEPVE